MGDGYKDAGLECTSDALRIRGYYFPWGTKVVPYASIKGLQRFEMSLFRGRGRVWGTANLKYWAYLDPRRPSKTVGFILDVGKSVCPILTPDDPDAFEVELRRRAGLGPSPEAPNAPLL